MENKTIYWRRKGLTCFTKSKLKNTIVTERGNLLEVVNENEEVWRVLESEIEILNLK